MFPKNIFKKMDVPKFRQRRGPPVRRSGAGTPSPPADGSLQFVAVVECGGRNVAIAGGGRNVPIACGGRNVPIACWGRNVPIAGGP